MDYKEHWKQCIAKELNALLAEEGITEKISPEDLTAELPPKPEMGDIGFPMFAYAKMLRKGPPQIAAMLAGRLSDKGSGTAAAEGPYVNIRLDRKTTGSAIIKEILDHAVGKPGTYSGSRIMEIGRAHV